LAPVRPNPFIPFTARLKESIELTPDVKLLRLELDDEAIRNNLVYYPGQFAFVSAFGVGESPFGITSVAYQKDSLEFAIRRVGTVTNALHELEPGAIVGVRGPFGNYFPLEDYKGKNIVIIGGGIGMAPLRPVIRTILDNRQHYGQLTTIIGARSPSDLVFVNEYENWAKQPDSRLELTVDRGDANWKGRVALIPAVIKELQLSPDNSVAIICGPPIMIRFVLVELKALGFAPQQIVTTLEAKMKCGLGKCARCNVGEKYICQDGPVFRLDQISTFLEQF